jgi:proliferating cell nuclear antigen
MKLTLAEPGYLKDSIAVISELVNEARFKINPNAVELIAMDPANVAMVVFKLLSSCFTEYDVKKDIEIAINLSNLKQVLRRASPNDTLTLELLEDNKLQVKLKSAATRTFSLPIIELEEKEQRVPNLKFPVVVKTSCALFDDAIADVDIVAEAVNLIAEKDKLLITAEGDLSKAHVEIKTNEETEIKSEAAGRVKAKYSIEYLKKIIAASKLTDKVELSFGDDYPLKVDYKIVDKLLLSFILAPRVESE